MLRNLIVALSYRIIAFTYICGVLFFLLAASVAQAEVFRYTTEDGVLSFTDEEKMIPARYNTEFTSFTLEELKERVGFTKVVVSPEVRARPLRLLEVAAKTKPASRTSFSTPLRVIREMRWLPGISGSPGLRYVSVDVLYDAEEREIAWALSDIGLGTVQGRFTLNE